MGTGAHSRYTGSLVGTGAHSRYTGSLVRTGAHSRYTGSLAGSWVRYLVLVSGGCRGSPSAAPPSLPSRVGNDAGWQRPGHLGALAWPASVLGGAADVATGSGNPHWAAVLGMLCLPFPPGPLPDRFSCPGEQGKLPAGLQIVASQGSAVPGGGPPTALLSWAPSARASCHGAGYILSTDPPPPPPPLPPLGLQPREGREGGLCTPLGSGWVAPMPLLASDIRSKVS